MMRMIVVKAKITTAATAASCLACSARTHCSPPSVRPVRQLNTAQLQQRHEEIILSSIFYCFAVVISGVLYTRRETKKHEATLTVAFENSIVCKWGSMIISVVERKKLEG